MWSTALAVSSITIQQWQSDLVALKRFRCGQHATWSVHSKHLANTGNRNVKLGRNYCSGGRVRSQSMHAVPFRPCSRAGRCHVRRHRARATQPDSSSASLDDHRYANRVEDPTEKHLLPDVRILRTAQCHRTRRHSWLSCITWCPTGHERACDTLCRIIRSVPGIDEIADLRGRNLRASRQPGQ